MVKNTLDGKDAFDGMTVFFERAYSSKVDPKIDSCLIYIPTSYDKNKKYPLVCTTAWVM